MKIHYAKILTQKKYSTVLGTIIIERLADFIVIAPFLVLLYIYYPADFFLSQIESIIAIAFLLILIIFLLKYIFIFSITSMTTSGSQTLTFLDLGNSTVYTLQYQFFIPSDVSATLHVRGKFCVLSHFSSPNSRESSRKFLVTDRDLGLGLGLGRDCLFGGISVLGRDSSNLGREPRHNKLLYFSNFY